MRALVGRGPVKATVRGSDGEELTVADMGWLPQAYGFPPMMKVADMLAYAAWLKGLDGSRMVDAVERGIEEFGLQEWRGHRLHQLSGGTRNRVGVAAVTLSRPTLLLLDEPTAGLDPVERQRLHSSLLSIRSERTVLVSSHLIEDVETMASWVLVLREGGIAYQGPASSLAENGESFRSSIMSLLVGTDEAM